jgi:hypothetical protein
VTRHFAALALALAAATPTCGEKEERVVGPSRVEVHALVAAGLTAAGADVSAASALRFRAAGPTLHVRLVTPVTDGPVGRLLASLDGASAEIEPFCPKPAVLRCRPGFRAWAVPVSRGAMQRSTAALRRLAARTYHARLLVRRRGRTTRVVTANGELLAAVGRAGPELTLAFGGLEAPRRPTAVPAGRLAVEAGPEALAAISRDLPPSARQALAGMRRLVVSLPL